MAVKVPLALKKMVPGLEPLFRKIRLSQQKSSSVGGNRKWYLSVRTSKLAGEKQYAGNHLAVY